VEQERALQEPQLARLRERWQLEVVRSERTPNSGERADPPFSKAPARGLMISETIMFLGG
jgi:hypothetical protein